MGFNLDQTSLEWCDKIQSVNTGKIRILERVALNECSHLYNVTRESHSLCNSAHPFLQTVSNLALVKRKYLRLVEVWWMESECDSRFGSCWVEYRARRRHEDTILYRLFKVVILERSWERSYRSSGFGSRSISFVFSQTLAATCRSRRVDDSTPVVSNYGISKRISLICMLMGRLVHRKHWWIRNLWSRAASMAMDHLLGKKSPWNSIKLLLVFTSSTL